MSRGLGPEQGRAGGGGARPVLGAALGGAWVGAVDAVFVGLADTLPVSADDTLARVGLQGLILGLVGALAAAALRRLGARSPGLGPLVGLGAALGLDLIERALRDPPPFSEPPLLHQHPSLLFLALVAGAGAVALLARLASRGGAGRLVLPLAFALALGLQARPARTLPAAGSVEPGARPLVLVTLDTTRDDHVGEGARARTPTLSALAERGARFELALAQTPVTGPSHTTMLSGTGPWRHGVLLNGHAIPAELPLLPELLRDRGYRTGAFVSAYVLEGGFGFARGFEVYDDDFGRVRGWAETLVGRLAGGLARRLDPDRALERRADATVDHALGWLEREGLAAGSEPFFLWVHLFDPHGPYEPPAPWDRAYYEGDPRDPAHDSMREARGVAPYLLPSLAGITDLRWPLAQYAGEVSYADQELGRLLAWLDRHHPDALVVVAGDHGESLGEHGVWFNHGDDLFEPSTRVPLVLRMAGRVPAGLRVQGPVELVDLAPTLLDLLGLEGLAGAEGRSLAPWLSASPPAEPPHLFARSFTYDRPANVAARQRGELEAPRWRMVALRTATGRYVLREAPGEGARWYDLAAADDESVTADPPPELEPALRASAEALLAGEARPAADALDAATEEKLRALGYVDE